MAAVAEVEDRTTDTLVGATFVGSGVAELLHSATTAMVGKVRLEALWHAVPSWPGLGYCRRKSRTGQRAHPISATKARTTPKTSISTAFSSQTRCTPETAVNNAKSERGCHAPCGTRTRPTGLKVRRSTR
jgi:hypothetical protein